MRSWGMNRIAFIGLWALMVCPLGAQSAPFYRGLDLSYVNEVEDFGGVYREGGQPVEPFELFARHGANLVRVRLWVDATWTNYSNLADVTKTLARGRAQGMDGLLALHYSDNWADPKAQGIPASWKALSEDDLVQKVHDYTRQTLESLDDAGVLPALVQIGNEINPGLLKRGVLTNEWDRDVRLINAGLAAVAEVAQARGRTIGTVLHVAQPQNADWWFSQARDHGIADFDVIGLSYYPQWSPYSVEQCGQAVEDLAQKFGKRVLVVETGAPWTLDRVPETASNVLNQGIPGYSIRPQGQRDYLVDLTRSLARHGGAGLVYWEPAWISTKAKTRWGQGSHWENATFFDFRRDNEVLPAIDFLSVSVE